MSLIVRRALTTADRDGAFAVRRAVFVEEQKVPLAAEVDGHEGEARHFVAVAGAEIVAAARWRWLEPDLAKLERFAVLAGHRRRGLGRALLAAVLADAIDAGAREAVLHAQVTALGLYRAAGFTGFGARFVEEGIPHQAMRLALPPAHSSGNC